jgi:hypothetical protein
MQRHFSKVIVFWTLLFLKSFVTATSYVSVTPENLTPGSNFTLKMDTEKPQGTLSVELFPEMQHINSPHFYFFITDLDQQHTLLFGDKNSDAREISIDLEMPNSDVMNQCCGKWRVIVLDEKSQAETSFYLISHAELRKSKPNLLELSKESLIKLILGQRSGDYYKEILCIKFLDSGATKDLLELDYKAYKSPRFSPASSQTLLFAALSNEGGIWNIYTYNWSSKTLQHWDSDTISSCSPIWSPNGKQLAFIQNNNVIIKERLSNSIITIPVNQKISKLVQWVENDTILCLGLPKLNSPLLISQNAIWQISEDSLDFNSAIYYKLNIKNHYLEKVAYNPFYKWLPNLSKNGDKLIVDLRIDSLREIWSVSLNDANETEKYQRITDDDYDNYYPALSSDSKLVVFVSKRPL